MINRNPDDSAKIEPEKDAEAKSHGLKRIQVFVDRAEGEPDSPDCPPISFFAYTDFIPRKGETMKLNDGKLADVKDVFYMLQPMGKTGFIFLDVAVCVDLRPDEKKKKKGKK